MCIFREKEKVERQEDPFWEFFVFVFFIFVTVTCCLPIALLVTKVAGLE